jgi:predicted AAA+ superfamily ATPase
MYKRSIDLANLSESFFLWGPRQTGKSSLLKKDFEQAFWIDLLKSDVFARYASQPQLLREEVQAAKLKPGSWVVIDEIQKAPALLDEVHWLIENRKLSFALSGSSARKLKRGHANLLGGRALRRELVGLTADELGNEFDLTQLLNYGTLPRIYSSETPLVAQDRLSAYVGDYLKEEIAAEGLVRNLPAFSQFLSLAALWDTEVIEFATFARDTGVSAPTIRSYYEILIDTLLGNFLDGFRFRPKRRVETTAKFYFFDVGVVNQLARRGKLQPGSELYGKAFENWVHHELRAYQAYRMRDMEMHTWRLSTQVEVDFVVNRLAVALEAKSSEKIHADHLRGLREIEKEYPKKVGKRVVVCREPHARITEDGIEILPFQHFVSKLWSGDLIA